MVIAVTQLPADRTRPHLDSISPFEGTELAQRIFCRAMTEAQRFVSQRSLRLVKALKQSKATSSSTSIKRPFRHSHSGNLFTNCSLLLHFMKQESRFAHAGFRLSSSASAKTRLSDHRWWQHCSQVSLRICDSWRHNSKSPFLSFLSNPRWL